MTLARTLALLAVAFTLSGCAAQRVFDEGRHLIEAGDPAAGLARVEEAIRLDPSHKAYRVYLARQRELAAQRLLAQAETARQRGELEPAKTLFQQAAAIDPSNPRGRQGIDTIAMDERHRALYREAEAAFKVGHLREAQDRLRAIFAQNKDHRDAQALHRQLTEQQAAAGREKTLAASLHRPITLEFRDTDLKTIMELVSRTTGLNFFFDKDVRPDLRTTVFVRNASIDDVLRFILVTNQLERKILNENTLLIYPNTPAKTKEYQELVTKSFYLAHADVKQTANMIKGMVKTRDVFIDEKLKLVVMRDTPDAVRMAEKLVAAQDLAESEVMLEVEVMEVASGLLTELGLRFPSQVSVSMVGAGGTAGTVTLPEWQNRNSALYRISATNPLLIANFRDQLSRANTLANPRIRVRDGQKAKIHIGDRVPVITTTLTATSFVSESVSYLDVGLKLDVEPTISLANEVAIKVGLEVSNIVREIRSASGTLTYQLGTRNANTALHLKDGETQILAGLISDDERKVADRVPGLGSLPIVGRLFSTHNDTATKTEIVLLITPRILRTVARPDIAITEFYSGTEAAVGAPPLVLRSVGIPFAVSPPTQQPTRPSSPPAPGASSGAPPASAAVQSGTRLVLQTPLQARIGDSFTMAIDMLPDTPVGGATVELAFDQSRLAVTRVEEGEALRGAGEASSFKYNVQQGTGRLNVIFALEKALADRGTLAKVTFQVVSTMPGTTMVSIASPSAVDGAGRSVALNPPGPATMSLTR